MSTDRSAASEEPLKKEMARLTAEFATERALDSLRRAIKVGRTGDIARWATSAAEAAMEVAGLVTVPDESANSFAMIRDSVANCLDSMTRAVQSGDTEGVLSRGELVGDTVFNFASFLKQTR